jgi:hypothetical protein
MGAQAGLFESWAAATLTDGEQPVSTKSAEAAQGTAIRQDRDFKRMNQA